jgi:hypothetical protein
MTGGYVDKEGGNGPGQELFLKIVEGENSMFQIISAFIALALLGSTAATAAPDQDPAYSFAKGCYNSQTCNADCAKAGMRYCELTCRRIASMKPPCK